tara:strand:+ start:803 stop:988 length:186 start_codon:yes stop_codon:yes gene_type:complete
MSEVVWSINIMIGILLIAVGISIYWIFKYDDWYPNPSVVSHFSSESESIDSTDEGSRGSEE